MKKNNYFTSAVLLVLSFFVMLSVSACNLTGKEEEEYTSVLEKLQTPQVSAESYNGVIRLSWVPDANADAYYVIRKASGEKDVVLVDKKLTYECSDWAANGYSFENGKTYTYYVTALSGAANGGMPRSAETAYTYIQNSSPAKISVKAKNNGEGSQMEEIGAEVQSQIFNGSCYTVVTFRPIEYNEKVVVEYKLGYTNHFSVDAATPIKMTLGAGVSQVRLPDLAGTNYIKLTNYFAGEDTDYFESISSEVETNGIESNYFGYATNFTATRYGEHVKLQWTGAEGATSYSIYRIESDGYNTTEPEWFELSSYSDGNLVSSDGKWYFIDTDAEVTYNYVYVVVAYRDDVCSNASASAIYSAVTPKITNFAVSRIDNDAGIVLTWDNDGYSTYELSYAKINAYNYQNPYSTLEYIDCSSIAGAIKTDDLVAERYAKIFKPSTPFDCAVVFRLTNSYGDVAYQKAQQAGTNYDFAVLQNATGSVETDDESATVKIQLYGTSLDIGKYTVYRRETDMNGLPKENWKVKKSAIGASATGVITDTEARGAHSGNNTKYYQYLVCQNVTFGSMNYELNHIVVKEFNTEDSDIITIIIPEQDL